MIVLPGDALLLSSRRIEQLIAWIRDRSTSKGSKYASGGKKGGLESREEGIPRRGGGSCLRTRPRAVSSATLVCRADGIVFSLVRLSIPLSLSCSLSLSLLVSRSSASALFLSAILVGSPCRVSMILSSTRIDKEGWREREREVENDRGQGVGEGRRVACTLIFAVTSFRDMSIDFISRGCFPMIRLTFSLLVYTISWFSSCDESCSTPTAPN